MTIQLKEGQKLYVLAGRLEQARFFAQENGVRMTRLYFVNSEYMLRGIKGAGQTLYVYGSARERTDYRAILDFAKERGFKISQVKITN